MVDKKIFLLSVGCINYDCNINFYESLKQLFPGILNYDYIQRLKQIGKASMNKEVLELIAKEKPDYVFFITYQTQIDVATLDAISEQGSKIIAWFSDDYWRFDLYSKAISAHVFCSVTTDKQAIDKYRKMGFNVIKSQWAANSEYYKQIHSPFFHDVSFVGQSYGSRKANIASLQKMGTTISVFGRGFGDFLTFNEIIKVFNSTKINLNFSGGSNNDSVKHIHGRIFEVTMCGGFLLTEYTEGIEEYFEIGKEIDCFVSLKEANEKIHYYLTHENERRKIAEAGHIRALKDHTWQGRLEIIFNKIEQQTNKNQAALAIPSRPKYEEAFHGDNYLLTFCDFVLMRSEIFIETGTYYGHTSEYVARSFKDLHVHSCEPKPEHFIEAKKKLAPFVKQVTLYQTTSLEFLRKLIQQDPTIVEKDTVFWLDAHSFGYDWPLPDEINFITKNFTKAYVFIDDFKNPGNPLFQHDKTANYECAWETIYEYLHKSKNYTLYFPDYTEKTSTHHPLVGWLLIEFGHTEMQIPLSIEKNVKSINYPLSEKVQVNNKKEKNSSMNILLATSAAPSQTPFSTTEKRPPIGIGFLISVLKKAGHNVFFLDNYLKPTNFTETNYLQINNINYVGIYANTICYRDTLRMLHKLEWLRQTNRWNGKIIIGGPHTTVCPDTIPDFVDYIVQGEGEQAIVDIIAGKTDSRIIKAPRIKNLDELPPPAWDYFVNLPYDWGGTFFTEKPVFVINSSRGCPFRCLTGNTVIHTINGDFPIKDLIGKTGVKVLSRDPITQMPLYTDAIHIRKTQDKAEIIRVIFDDESHIDCTPDHKFKVFKSKNQYIEESEWNTEAKDLKPKQQVRAVRFEVQKTGRTVVSTRRDITPYRSRIIMEAILGRKLTKIERIHHKDEDPRNDHPSNLVLTDTVGHSFLHPKIAERMRKNNPAKNMTQEWRRNIAKNGKGKKRSLEQRIRYRKSKIGTKNPNYNPNIINHKIRPSRIKELPINHKVLRVEKLLYREDVYCMEIPGINWFYANKVLVHNCSYCSVGSIWGKKYTCFSADRVVSDIEYLIKNYGAKGIYFREDNFTLDEKRLTKFCNLLIDRNIRIPWACESRVSSINSENIKLMKKAGVCGFYFGVESGSQRVLDFVKKDITIEQTRNTFRLCHEYGIKSAASIIVGVPTETEKELNQTLMLVNEIKPTVTWFNVFTGIPNSELYKYTIENNLYEFIDDRGLVYLKGHNKLTKRFYGGGWDANIPSITSEVSVVMSVYNGEKYLKKAINSILQQSYQNFEFIIIDDGSTDKTSEILKSFKDFRIKVIRNIENIGLTKSLNKGIKAAKGQYIARMDADDISLPHRLEIQIGFLEKHSDFALVGSSYYQIDDFGKIVAYIKVLTENLEIRAGLLQQNWFGHGSVMMRKSAFVKCKGYNEEFEYAQDYDLWLRLSEYFKVANIEEPLYCWRLTLDNISILQKKKQTYYAALAVSATRIRNTVVSVIVPTYNRPEMLRVALDSIFKQTHQNFEVIVVNDAGIDVKNIIAEFDKSRITYICHIQNKGLAATRNTGFSVAKGKYISYLDDDDIFYPDHLETLVSFLENSEYRIAYTDANGANQVREANGDYKIAQRWLYMSRDFSRDSLLQNNIAPVHCFMHEKACLTENNLKFDEGLLSHEDWDLWIRLSRKYDFKHIRKTTVEYRHRKIGFTQLSQTPKFSKTGKIVQDRYRNEKPIIPSILSTTESVNVVESVVESAADAKRIKQGRRRVYKEKKDSANGKSEMRRHNST